jgi:putative tricarboxylic transport membrane protein
MAPKSKPQIVVEDPDALAAESPTVTRTRTVDIAVSLLLLALAAVLGYDNWRTGMGWEATGPQAGYFPFYLAVILAAACLWGLTREFLARQQQSPTFVTRAQLRRVLQVFIPTLLFCLFMQWLGLYAASFLLIAGFMVFVGRIAIWKSLLTALLFSLIMFATFDLAFDVIMPKGPLESLFGR